MVLSNKVYDILKWAAMIVLPAIATLYAALAGIWHFPYGDEIVGTIAAIVTFLGALLKISRSKYEGDGTLEIDTTNTDQDIYRLNINTPLEDLAGKKEILLKVDPNASLTSQE